MSNGNSRSQKPVISFRREKTSSSTQGKPSKAANPASSSEGDPMPAVYLSVTEKSKARLVAFIYSELKVRGLHQVDLADHMGISQQALCQKLKRRSFHFEDFVLIMDFFKPDDFQLHRIIGKGG